MVVAGMPYLVFERHADGCTQACCLSDVIAVLPVDKPGSSGGIMPKCAVCPLPGSVCWFAQKLSQLAVSTLQQLLQAVWFDALVATMEAWVSSKLCNLQHLCIVTSSMVAMPW